LVHYHIRWSTSKLDWEVFKTRYEAETAARQLVLPEETYTIEHFDGDCPNCSTLQSRLLASRDKLAGEDAAAEEGESSRR